MPADTTGMHAMVSYNLLWFETWKNAGMEYGDVRDSSFFHRAPLIDLLMANCQDLGTWGHWGRRMSTVRGAAHYCFPRRRRNASSQSRYDVPEVPTSPSRPSAGVSVMTFTPYRPHNNSIFGRSVRGTT
jgi:hypothetical protein